MEPVFWRPDFAPPVTPLTRRLLVYFRSGAYTSRRSPHFLHVHGIVLTSWFVLFLVQTTLIASRHTDIHRRLGVAGAILAIVVVVVSLMVNIRAIPRSPANGLSAAELPGLIGANIASLLNFSVLAASGIYLRRRPETHKRLMLLASISIIGPALSRIPGVHEFPALYLVGMLSLFIALPLYDIIRNRRVHPATAWALPLLILIWILGIVVGMSSVGRSFIHSLA